MCYTLYILCFVLGLRLCFVLGLILCFVLGLMFCAVCKPLSIRFARLLLGFLGFRLVPRFPVVVPRFSAWFLRLLLWFLGFLLGLLVIIVCRVSVGVPLYLSGSCSGCWLLLFVGFLLADSVEELNTLVGQGFLEGLYWELPWSKPHSGGKCRGDAHCLTHSHTRGHHPV